MFTWAKENGYLRTLDWNDYDLANSVMQLPTVSTEEINRMYKTAYREFFFRPGFLLRRLLRMRSLGEIKMNLQALRSIMFVRGTALSASAKARSVRRDGVRGQRRAAGVGPRGSRIPPAAQQVRGSARVEARGSVTKANDPVKADVCI
jgi:hypothetical protein